MLQSQGFCWGLEYIFANKVCNDNKTEEINSKLEDAGPSGA